MTNTLKPLEVVFENEEGFDEEQITEENDIKKSTGTNLDEFYESFFGDEDEEITLTTEEKEKLYKEANKPLSKKSLWGYCND